MNIILMGPPGAGKGTQAPKICATYNIPHCSTGDMLRAAKAAGTPMGKSAQAYMDAAKLVPDEVVNGIIAEVLSVPGRPRGILLDGYPRTTAQAEALEGVLKNLGQNIDRVVVLDVPRALVIERISGRWTCPKCNAIYQSTSAPPKVAGKCDRDETPLVQRADDTNEKANQRVDDYEHVTAAVGPFYERRGLLRRVDGTGTPDVIFERIRAVLL